MTSPLLLGSFKRQLIGTSAAVIGWIAYSYLPKTAGVTYANKWFMSTLPFYREINERFEPATLALVDEVFSDINSHQTKPINRDRLKFFQTNSFLLSDARHLGSSSTGTGAIILLPIGVRPKADEVFHYHCSIENSVDMAEFCLISKEAKKFLIARQIYYCEDGFTLFRCLCGIALLGFASVMFYFINSVLDMRKQIQYMKFEKESSKVVMEQYADMCKFMSKKSRTASVFYLACLCVPLYKIITAAYSVHLEQKTHDKLAELGPEYVRGGKEYYEKVVTGNKYEYRVFGDQELVTPTGDFVQGKYSLFNDCIPVTNKLKFFVECCEKLKPSLDT